MRNKNRMLPKCKAQTRDECAGIRQRFLMYGKIRKKKIKVTSFSKSWIYLILKSCPLHRMILWKRVGRYFTIARGGKTGKKTSRKLKELPRKYL